MENIKCRKSLPITRFPAKTGDRLHRHTLRGLLGFAGSPWVFNNDNSSASNCASNCANNCGNNVQNNAVFRGSVFRGAHPCKGKQFRQPAGQSAWHFSDRKIVCFFTFCIKGGAMKPAFNMYKYILEQIHSAGAVWASSHYNIPTLTNVRNRQCMISYGG